MFKLNEKLFSKEDSNNDPDIIKKDSKYYNNERLKESFNYKLTDELIKVKDINEINICAYNVDTSGIYPFIRFLLCKNNEEYDFIKIDKKYLLNKSNEEAIQLCNEKLNSLFNIESKYLGSYSYEKKVYVFMEIMTNTHTHTLKDFCLIDEIVNIRSNSSFKINEKVTYFFISNISVFLLYDEENKPIEIPSVMYLSRENPNVQFTSSIEIGKGDSFSMFGPHYYFTNYRNASAILKNEKDELLRYAIFTGKQLVKLNYPEDTIDLSRIKKDRLNEKEEIRKYEILTMRLSDYDGVWADKYDSLYIGNLKLDDDSKIKSPHVCCIKDRSRCIFLSKSLYISK